MKCFLCPRQCGADRSVRPGFCGLGEEMLIARAAPHLWEEPPVSGTRGTGAVFFIYDSCGVMKTYATTEWNKLNE